MNGGQPPPGALGLGEASAPNPTPPPVAAPPARDRGRRRRIAVVAAIVVIVVVAGGLGGYFVLTHRAASGTRVVDDGPTFYHALAQVNGTVQNVTGYPWALFSVFGVAAQAPFSANVLSYIFENYTVNTCGRLFNGPTLWNGTMPVFTGTFDSGTAPFWQFAFYSNTTHEDLIATDVLGTPYVYPPEQNQQPGTCYPWNAVPGPLAWSKALSLVSVNSPTAGAAAWGAVSSYWPQADEPWVQIITLGPSLFNGVGYATGGYLVLFDRCGLVDVAGDQPQLAASVNWSNPSGEAVAGGPGGTNCATLSSYQGQPGVDYNLLFAHPVAQNVSTTDWVTSPFQVAYVFAANGTPMGYYDGWGLANWMTSWNLTTPAGQLLPLAAPTCESWVPSISDCVSNTSGWYAVVLSQSGEWINSYGLQPNGTRGWAEPVTALVSHQQLVIVTPSSWNVSGDRLSVTSTVATSTVVGTVTL